MTDQGNEAPVLLEGWSRRRDDPQSLAWHYFRDGISLCPRHWRDPLGPYTSIIRESGIVCTDCMRRRLNDYEHFFRG